MHVYVSVLVHTFSVFIHRTSYAFLTTKLLKFAILYLNELKFVAKIGHIIRVRNKGSNKKHTLFCSKL